MALPGVTETLTRYTGCCPAVSSDLLKTIGASLPSDPCVTLSIGSGTGLFEALLQAEQPFVNIEGVEIAHSVNIHLPEENLNIVAGTWDLCSRLPHASALMFVYPREPRLVKRYLDDSIDALSCVIWLGPQADWADYQDVLAILSQHRFSITAIPDDIAAPYEKIMIYRRSDQTDV